MGVGGIELGGTKVLCGIGNEAGELTEYIRIPTQGPETTLAVLIDYFRQHPIAALGIAAFGPVSLDRQQPDFGTLLNTPKLPWRGVNLYRPFRAALGVPIVIQTDVCAAAAAESVWGAARDVATCLYLTVGTGVGGGTWTSAGPWTVKTHPEMGHISVRRNATDSFKGVCPAHGDCLEGLASGPAIAARWGTPSSALPPDHPAWTLEAYYLAQALVTYIYVLAPERIIVGGGVLQQAMLYPAIRSQAEAMLQAYYPPGIPKTPFHQYIVPPQLGDTTGLRGALWLASTALKRHVD